MMHKIKEGKIVLEKVNKKSFEYYSSLFLRTKSSLKPNSYKQYDSQIRFWNSHFSSRDIASIKASEIKEILLNHNVIDTTKKDLLDRIKAVFEEAEVDEEIKHNPASKIRLPRSRQKKTFLPFDKDQVKRILDEAEDYFKVYLAVGFYTGLRTGEILALKWQNIDFSKKLIFIDATVGQYEEQLPKTITSTRYVPIFESLVPFLKEQQKRTGLGKYVFCTRTGSTLQGTNLIAHRWKPLLRKLKIPYRRLYETRHTFATNMLSSNKFSLNQIAAWLGHSSIQTLITKYNSYIPSEIAKFDSQFDVFKDRNVTNEVTEETKNFYRLVK